MRTIKTALLSVYDKTGVVDFARGLHELGVQLLSTGGTASTLADAGLPVRQISEHTASPEMLDGRVKTLHPKVFGGILARRDDDSQMAELGVHKVLPIDLVAVNLYPFAATVARPQHTVQEALEQIDIGGVTLLRAAAKNSPGVVVVVDPANYDEVLDAVCSNDLPLSRRLVWAARAIAHTASYEASICNYLSGLPETAALDATPELQDVPDTVAMTFDRVQGLRYGENPHQKAAFFADEATVPRSLGAAEQLQGKELSFNNILDLDAAWRLVRALSVAGAVVMKHNNPCGAACGESLVDAYVKARATDPVSAFGSVLGFNEPVDVDTAGEIVTTFVEAIAAPGFTSDALEILREKENLRLLNVPTDGELAASYAAAGFHRHDIRWVDGGLLVQDRDPGAGIPQEEWVCVTDRQPSDEEEAGLRFAWSVIPYVKSNAILLARGQQLIGIGAGQMSRVDSCRIATWKAKDFGHQVAGAVAASDAFFPFPDGPESLAEAGVTAIVQPGGSMRDEEVIEVADRLGIAMVLTKTRHFLH
ncbi:MAG: bifunctional phosphoribosylaminoimidazolecarboxamide formyltransferase/IMP cyclohydrolase [Acidobacteria bacterium]|nr:bifunctional phosphoribosylaminoimidazolecarboxamide formyltransferase/IMP cyclohydrolase [Acidobacteriota bacterium]